MTQSLNELAVVVVVVVVVVVAAAVVVSEKVSSFGKQNYDLKRENIV